MSRIIHALLAGCLVVSPVALTMSAATAAAQKKKPERKEHAEKAALESGDESRIIEALGRIAKAKDESAVPLVAALIRTGSSKTVMAKAFEVSGVLEASDLSAPIAPYLRHRDQELRRAAAKTLIKTKGEHAVKALRRGLRSSDGVVRGLSATGLGTLKAEAALPDLFSALDRNVLEAAAAIGQICKPDACGKLLDRLGKTPFDVMTSGLDQILFRDPKAMPDDEKMRIVGQLRELGTAQAGKYLASVAERWPEDWSQRIKKALDAAVKATGADVIDEDEDED